MSQDADTLASAFGEADEAVDLSGVMPEAWLALAFFWLLGLTVFYQFITRYVFNDSAAWTEEIARYLLIATVFIGATIGVAKNNHIQVDFFYRFLPKSWARVMALFIDLLRIAFLACASWLTWELMQKMGSYQMTIVNLPMNLVYGVVLLAFVLMTWRGLWVMRQHALSLVVGNFYYGWLAYRQGQAQGRDDLTALPYGINTVSLFAYVFLVMLPVRLTALNGGASSEQAAELAWGAGLVACLGSGLIELGGAWIADRLRQVTPRAALLSTLAGIALTFIAIGFLLRTYAHPLVGLVPLGVILLTYYGQVKFTLPGTGLEIPGGLLAVILGTALAWITGLCQWDPAQLAAAAQPMGLYIPRPWIGHLWEQRSILVTYLSVIVPMGLFNLVGSLQNLESAEAAGDSYPAPPCLAANGIGTLAAALFGSCFPTTIYIGHPGWKAMGARIGYSWLNGVIMGLFCISGTVGILAFFVPIDSGMAIVLWIGIVIVGQSFTAVPSHHTPAVVVGLLPGIAGWGALIAKNALRSAGLGTLEAPFTPDLVPLFQLSDTYITGAFALEQGLIFSAMILAAMTVEIIDRNFGKAALWSCIAALLSWFGLLHSYQWTIADTVIHLGWGTGASWAAGYGLLGLLLFYAQWQKQPQ